MKLQISDVRVQIGLQIRFHQKSTINLQSAICNLKYHDR